MVDYVFSEHTPEPSNIKLGGGIKLMEINPNGSKVLLAYDGKGPGKELIVVATMFCNPIPTLKYM